jgi:hypothetical protein
MYPIPHNYRGTLFIEPENGILINADRIKCIRFINYNIFISTETDRIWGKVFESREEGQIQYEKLKELLNTKPLDG